MGLNMKSTLVIILIGLFFIGCKSMDVKLTDKDTLEARRLARDKN